MTNETRNIMLALMKHYHITDIFDAIENDFSNMEDVYKAYLKHWYDTETDKVENENSSKTFRGVLISDLDYIEYQQKYILDNLQIEKLHLADKKKHIAFINFLNSKAENQNGNVKNDEVYKNQNLFNVGLLFATGQMNKYFTVNNINITVMNLGFSAPKIAKELNNQKSEKWILASLNNYAVSNVNGHKNIFNSYNMMTKIIEHCKMNNIEVDPYFLSRLPID